MLTVNELNYTLDSLNKNLKTDIISFSENSNSNSNSNKKKIKKRKRNHFLKDVLSCTLEQQSDILKIAVSNQTSIGTDRIHQIELDNKRI
jgi:lipopolysaccharide export system permease protein